MSVAERPKPFMPEEELAWLREAYEGATTILEYGSGYSTVMASEMGGKRVTSVESDAAFGESVQAWLDGNVPGHDTRVVHCDIGETKRFGYPVSAKQYRRFARYPLDVWNLPDFRQPDVVLIDGRFRTGCLLAVMYRTARPVTVYFDDYMNRKRYHHIEDWLKPVESRGRMARFEVEPTAINPQELAQIIDIFGRRP